MYAKDSFDKANKLKKLISTKSQKYVTLTKVSSKNVNIDKQCNCSMKYSVIAVMPGLHIYKGCICKA